MKGQRSASARRFSTSRSASAPRHSDNTKVDLEGETVVFAVGKAPDPRFADGPEVKIERRLAQADGSCMTGMKGVSACREAVRAPGSAIDCIAVGRKLPPPWTGGSVERAK